MCACVGFMGAKKGGRVRGWCSFHVPVPPPLAGMVVLCLSQSLKWCQVGEAGVDDVDRHVEGLGDGLDGFESYGIFTVFDSSQVGALNASA